MLVQYAVVNTDEYKQLLSSGWVADFIDDDGIARMVKREVPVCLVV